MPPSEPTDSAPSTPAPFDFGGFRGLDPVDANFGASRGRPVDRFYIERFLGQHQADIRGVVLEVADDRYTRQFGADRVTASELLHRDPANSHATWTGDLADGTGLPSDRFDCFICTQTLQYVFELGAAIATIHRMLHPGGVLLLTVPSISQISPYDRDHWGEHWRFTPHSIERLLRARFDDVQVAGHGNVLAATAFLQGLAWEDLTLAELEHVDDRYPTVVTGRAVKKAA